MNLNYLMIFLYFITLMQTPRGYSQALNFKTIIPPHLDIGTGYNSLLGINHQRNMAICIDKKAGVSPIGGETDNSTSKIHFHFYESIEDVISDFDSTINVGAKIGINHLSLGFDIKSKTVDETNDHHRYVFAIIEIEKTYPWLNLNEITLTPKASLFFQDHPDQFFKKCGDRFVSSIRFGVKALVQIACSYGSVEEKNKIANILKATPQMKRVPVSGKINLEDKITHYENETKNECHFYAENIDTIPFKTGVKDFITTVSKRVLSSPLAKKRVIDFDTSPYSVLLDKELYDTVLSQTTNHLDLQKNYLKSRRISLKRSYHYLFNLQDLLAQSPGDFVIRGKMASILEEISHLKNEIKRCGLNPYNKENCFLASPNKEILTKMGDAFIDIKTMLKTKH